MPLSGVKVVELATFVAVPAAARMLAAWGADVVKVESPQGDDFRPWAAVENISAVPEEAPAFANVNMNKRVAAIDLKHPEGKEAFLKLIRGADVFMTNVRTKSLRKLGLDYDSLKELNPSLIYASFTGFGTKGKDAARPGFDAVAFWTRCGSIDWVDEGDFPMRHPTTFGDMACSSVICSGVLAALMGRAKTGRGTFVSSALYAHAIWCGSIPVISTQERYGNQQSRPDGKNRPKNPLSHPYRCGDGEWIRLSAASYEGGGLEKICRAMGLEDCLSDERFNTLHAVQQPENMKAFLAVMRGRFEEKTADEWCQVFVEHDVIHEKYLHYQDVAKDQQAWENHFLHNVGFPSGAEVALPNLPVMLEDYPEPAWNLPGEIGADTSACLREAGYSDEEISRLRQEKAIR